MNFQNQQENICSLKTEQTVWRSASPNSVDENQTINMIISWGNESWSPNELLPYQNSENKNSSNVKYWHRDGATDIHGWWDWSTIKSFLKVFCGFLMKFHLLHDLVISLLCVHYLSQRNKNLHSYTKFAFEWLETFCSHSIELETIHMPSSR